MTYPHQIAVAQQNLLLILLQHYQKSKQEILVMELVVELRVELIAVEVVMAVESNISRTGNSSSGTEGKDEPWII